MNTLKQDQESIEKMRTRLLKRHQRDTLLVDVIIGAGVIALLVYSAPLLVSIVRFFI